MDFLYSPKASYSMHRFNKELHKLNINQIHSHNYIKVWTKLIYIFKNIYFKTAVLCKFIILNQL